MSRAIPWMLFCILLISPTLAQAFEEDSPYQGRRFAIGFLATFPAYGPIFSYNLSDNISIQGTFTPFGDLRFYAGRGVFRFRQSSDGSLYAWGMAGIFSYSGFNTTSPFESRRESTTGFAAGGGYERVFGRLGLSGELGLARVGFDEVDYNFSSFTAGGSLVYYF